MVGEIYASEQSCVKDSKIPLKALAPINLAVGVQIQFEARVKQYSKGSQGKKEDINKEIKQDYKLSHPTQVRVLGSDNKNTESKLIIRRAKGDSGI